MTAALVLDVGLGGLVLAVAVWSIAARENLAAIAGFISLGLLLAIVWVRLATVDVALTEAAIGGGATGVLLLGAAARLGQDVAVRTTIRARLVPGMLCVLVTVALAAVVLTLPEPPPTLAPEAAAGMAGLGVDNPVTAVLVGFRAIDTLLESVVLLLALIAVWSMTPDRLWGSCPTPWGTSPANDALTLLARLLAPVGVLVGIYLVWTGADHPGGAFQGGTILAAMWILLMMAGLVKVPAATSQRLRLILIAGPAVFVAIGLAGFAIGGSFLSYPTGVAKALIILIEVALTLSIAATLGLLVAGLPDRRP